MRRTTIVGLLAAVAITVGGVVPVAAQEDRPPNPGGGCTLLTQDGTTCNIVIVDPGLPGTTNILVTSNSGPQYSYVNTGIICNHTIAAQAGNGTAQWIEVGDIAGFLTFILGFGYTPGELPPEDEGALWFAEVIDPETGPTNAGLGSCVGVNEPPPDRPPIPPQPADVWGIGLLIDPELNIDPSLRGLTGLETYLWNEQPTYVTTSLTLRGYTVVPEIWAVEWQWDLRTPDRDGNTTYSATSGGTQDDPAVTHTFAEAEDATIAHTVVWVGQYTITHPLYFPDGVTVDLGSAAITATLDYDVIEVRTPVVRGG